ncbi:MAG: DUF983 domain-containing protein [Paracoccus sp. (in: a-proteobacteria)]|uniref:DUF983 domain-containing protein n=1 Tax=Paracoccus sp. TaxID=267 RepID=UPI0026DF4914|nr:DUF983 domain-containing protein [Paracoccus sp. (in: a-proteobacteria)]MDO5614276.1 DUF983 domain-containing protein [Paracoccus sp. (in: a-proteobacteria)]
MSGQDTAPERQTGLAMRRGFMGKCPSCGEGRLLNSYLKVNDHCPACGEAMHHQRADDGPAYLTILIVSHLGAPLLLWVYMAFRPSPMAMLIGFSLAAVVLSLLLLPRIKGAMVGLQWARRMHGFGSNAEPDSA